MELTQAGKKKNGGKKIGFNEESLRDFVEQHQGY